jgi:hypothetical protein
MSGLTGLITTDRRDGFSHFDGFYEPGFLIPKVNPH